MEVVNAGTGRKISETSGEDCPICLGLPSSPDEWRVHYQEENISGLPGVWAGVRVFRTADALVQIRRDGAGRVSTIGSLLNPRCERSCSDTKDAACHS